METGVWRHTWGRKGVDFPFYSECQKVYARLVKHRLFSILICLQFFSQASAEWSPWINQEVVPTQKRVSTDAFPQDQAMGIDFFSDPQTLRSVGSRQFNIYHSVSDDYTFYLNIGDQIDNNDLDEFRFPPDLIPPGILQFQLLAERVGVDQSYRTPFLSMAGSNPISRLEENDNWDFAYQKIITDYGYLSGGSCVMREQLLRARYGVNSKFIFEGGYLRSFLIESNPTKDSIAGQNESVGFVFDSDPFGFAYRIPQRDRVAAWLSRNNSLKYQWIRVSRDGEILWGDIHEITLPRPVNLGIIGDSYTSGEGAPFSEGEAKKFGLGRWITEYANPTKTHRSLSSGWEMGVSQVNRQKFGAVSLNFYNVSQSGAQVRVFDKNLVPKNESFPSSDFRLSGTTLEGSLSTASAQLRALELLIARDGHPNYDILGYTFGGNDAYFSAIIEAFLLLDGNDGDFNLSNLGDGGEDSNEYPPGTKDPFDKRFPGVSSLNDMKQVALDNLADRFGLRNRLQRLGVKKIIRGNYCNPLGSMTNYQPEGLYGDIAADSFAGGFDACTGEWLESDADNWAAEAWNYFVDYVIQPVLSPIGAACGAIAAGTTTAAQAFGGLLELDSWELDLIRSDIMPKINQDLVGFDAERASEILADTETQLPISHGHFISATDNWFAPMFTLDTDDEQFPFAFHPNNRGHKRVYAPVYREKLLEVLNSDCRSEIYEEEVVEGDLNSIVSFLEFGGARNNGTLFFSLVARNDGSGASSPSLVNMQVMFGPERERAWNAAGRGLLTRTERPNLFKEPLRDIDGDVIEIPSLAPGEVFVKNWELKKGELECTYYDLIIDHFLRLSNQDFIQDIVGNVSRGDLGRRLGAFLPLFGYGLSMSFELFPTSGLPEGNMSNNWFPSTQFNSIPFEPDIITMFSWAAKTRDQYFQELYERMRPAGLDPDNFEKLTKEDLFGNPKTLEDVFGVQDISLVTYDRSEVEVDQGFDISEFTETARVVEDALTLGPLNPKPIIFDKNLIEDYLVIETPLGSKRFGFDQWAEMPFLLPRDGGNLEAVYCRAEGVDKEGQQQYVDIPIQIKTEQASHGLESFYSDQLFNEEGKLDVNVSFAQRAQLSTFSGIARVRITDIVTGGVFYDYITQPDQRSLEIDLNRFLFHDTSCLVEVETLDENDTTSYSITHRNDSAISQTDIRRDGAFVEFTIDLSGEFASQISDDIGVSVIRQGGGISLSAPLDILNVSGGENPDGGQTKSMTVRLPIDFVFGSPKIIRIIDQSNPELYRISSINHSGLMGFLPPRGIAATHISPIDPNFANESGIIEGAEKGLVTIDVTRDLKRWQRVQSFMNDERGADQEVSLPNFGISKGFYRARVYELDE